MLGREIEVTERMRLAAREGQSLTFPPQGLERIADLLDQYHLMRLDMETCAEAYRLSVVRHLMQVGEERAVFVANCRRLFETALRWGMVIVGTALVYRMLPL